MIVKFLLFCMVAMGFLRGFGLVRFSEYHYGLFGDTYRLFWLAWAVVCGIWLLVLIDVG